MERDDVLKWLNYRLELSKQQQFIISTDDIIFIRNYIHHYKNKLIPMEQIGNSVKMHSHNLIDYLDFMATKLINDFDIKTKTEKHQITAFGHFMNIPQDAEIIIEYI